MDHHVELQQRTRGARSRSSVEAPVASKRPLVAAVRPTQPSRLTRCGFGPRKSLLDCKQLSVAGGACGEVDSSRRSVGFKARKLSRHRDDTSMSWRDSAIAGLSERCSNRVTDQPGRETWQCRSTVGATSDIDDDVCSEVSDGAEDDLAAEVRERSIYADNIARIGVSGGERKPRPRKLTLGDHFDRIRPHALKKIMPPIPVTPLGMDAEKATPHGKGRHLSSARHSAATKLHGALASKKKQQEGAHLTIYMDYDREEAFGTKPQRQKAYVVRKVWKVHIALFVSTACIHCVSFNVSPALRKLFRIETLPVGLCIVVTWTILGLVNCLGAWVGSRSGRVSLLRRLSCLWVFAIIILQVAKFLPLPARVANSLLGVGYVMAVVAHGLLVPNAVALGSEVVTSRALTTLDDNIDVSLRQQRTVEVAMGTYFTWTIAAMVLATSLVQVFYFAGVSFELNPGQDVMALRNRRTVCITIPCGALLLALIMTFLFDSRHHFTPQAPGMGSPQIAIPPPDASKSMDSMNAIERKLARGELDCLPIGLDSTRTSRPGFQEWGNLVRRSLPLVALSVFAFVSLLAVVAVLVAHVVPSRLTTSSTLAHLSIFATLAFSWLMTMMISTCQLAPAPRNKLYGRVDSRDLVMLPSRRQLFVLVTLVSLACTVALAAFVRAQLYSTLFVQTCQLRRSREASILFDPNVLAAWVGLLSVAALPVLQFSVRSKATSNPDLPSRLSPVRRVAIGILLYLVAIFLSSIVELYRRDVRRSPHEGIKNPGTVGCNKIETTNFSVWWSVPHLAILSLADAVFRVGTAEEAYVLTAPLNWFGLAQGILSLADSVGYASALALSTTLSSWLYQLDTSDLVLLLLIITAISSLSYSLTKRLADHVDASRWRPDLHEHEDTSDGEIAKEVAVIDDEEMTSEPFDQRTSGDSNPLPGKEALLLSSEQSEKLTPRHRLNAAQG